MPLNASLMFAEQACAYVDGLRIKASNRAENQQNVGAGARVTALRATLATHGSAPDSIENAGVRAGLAATGGVGNCHEQASLAFTYLLTKYGPSCGGLALVGTSTFDHVFLVVCLPIPRRAFAAAIPATLAVPPEDWLGAVVCDPWYHEWYEMKDFKPKMRQTLIQSSGARRIGDTEQLGLSYLARG